VALRVVAVGLGLEAQRRHGFIGLRYLGRSFCSVAGSASRRVSDKST
jgi:hypothetical protein